MKSTITLFFILFLMQVGYAQSSSFWSNFSFNAQAGVYGDFYNMQSFGEEIQPRRPNRLLRFMASGSVGFKGFNIPFSVLLTNNQQNLNVPLPVPTDQSIIDFITNPANSVGLSPKLKSGTITLGTYVPRHGLFTSGVLRVFGLGGDFTIKEKWRVAIHTGNAQIAVPENIILGQTGAYVRRVTSAKVGYGKDDDTHLHLVFFRANDREESQGSTLSLVPPQQNLVMGLNYKWKINDSYFVEGEFSQSAMTENLLEPSFVSERKLLSSIVHINATSRYGNAFKVSAGKTGKLFSLTFVGDYVSEGFRTLGYPFLQPDQLNITANPTFQLMNGKLSLNGSIGRRINNLAGEKQATAHQTIYSLNASYQLTDRLNLAASLGNFGFRNTLRNDTLRIENVSRSINLTPTYTIEGVTKIHTITGSIALESFRDFNVFTSAESDNNAITIMASYIIGWNGKPLSANFTAMQFNNNLPSMKLSMSTISTGANYSFLNKKIQTGLKLVYSSNATNDGKPANQLLTQVQYNHNLLEKLAFSFNGSINLYRFGDEKPDVRYRETLLRTSLIYKLK